MDPKTAPQNHIQVWENHAGGPVNLTPGQGGIYRYVSYINAENDTGIYGYGNTEAEAMEDYIRNMAEQICNGCTVDDCSDHDCVLAEPNFSNFLRQHMPEDDTSHREWREINGPISF